MAQAMKSPTVKVYDVKLAERRMRDEKEMANALPQSSAGWEHLNVVMVGGRPVYKQEVKKVYIQADGSFQVHKTKKNMKKILESKQLVREKSEDGSPVYSRTGDRVYLLEDEMKKRLYSNFGELEVSKDGFVNMAENPWYEEPQEETVEETPVVEATVDVPTDKPWREMNAEERKAYQAAKKASLVEPVEEPEEEADEVAEEDAD